MTAWASLLIPAGSAIFGGLVGGGAAVWGQYITHRGTTEREAEARHDAFRVKRHEIERDTLIELQEAISEHSVAWGLVTVREHLTDDPAELMASYGKTTTRATKLAARVIDDNARARVWEYLQAAHENRTPAAGDSTVDKAHARAQIALGEALRRDPFADPPKRDPSSAARRRLRRRQGRA